MNAEIASQSSRERMVDLNHRHSKRMADIDARKSLPFAVNSRGVLVHRVRSLGIFLSIDGAYSHHSAHYHCNAFASGVSLVAEPDQAAIVCHVCEARCKYLGLPSAEELVGRHVHVGRKVAIANCCSGVVVDHEDDAPSRDELSVTAQHVALGIGGAR